MRCRSSSSESFPGVRALEEDAALRGKQASCGQEHERGFARTVLPDQGHHAAGQLHIQPVEDVGVGFGVAEGDVLEDDFWAHGGRIRRRPPGGQGSRAVFGK
jgi:hypothetical protein